MAAWVPQLDFERARATLDRQVKRIGMVAILRRASGDRPCWMFFSQWSAKELMGGLVDPLDRLAIVSAVDPSPTASPNASIVPPDHTMDRLITLVQPSALLGIPPVEDENLRILQAPEKIAPAGVLLCWKLRVRR